MKPIRVATLCHNDDDRNDPAARRVRLELSRRVACAWSGDSGYVWRTESGEDCGLGVFESVTAATSAARSAWGQYCWDLRASWL